MIARVLSAALLASLFLHHGTNAVQAAEPKSASERAIAMEETVADERAQLDDGLSSRRSPSTARVNQLREAAKLRRAVEEELGRRLALSKIPVRPAPKGPSAAWSLPGNDYEASGTDRYKLTLVLTQHLQIASALQNQRAAESRRNALVVAYMAAQCAVFRLKDSKLAVGIAEAWIEPYLEQGSEDRSQYPSRYDVADWCIGLFSQAGEWKGMERAARRALAIAPTDNAC